MVTQISSTDRCTPQLIRKKTRKDLSYFNYIIVAVIVVVIGVGIYMASQDVDDPIGIVLWFFVVFPVLMGIFIVIALIVLLVIYIILYFTKRSKNSDLCQRDPEVFLKSM